MAESSDDDMQREPEQEDGILLCAAGISKRFGGIRALTDVSFRVSERQVLGVIGPNGSGKTTLFNIVTGFVPTNSGSITWLGRDITRMPAHLRARSGLVRTFQESMVFPGLTVARNIEVALVSSGRSKLEGELAALTEYTRLSHLRNNLAAELSWGQSRLLGIALALATSPKLLLMDEPFAGLSPAAVDDVSQTIRQMKADGIPLVIIDHQMNYLMPLCDEALVLDFGTKIAEGTPAEVLDHPRVREAYLGNSA